MLLCQGNSISFISIAKYHSCYISLVYFLECSFILHLEIIFHNLMHCLRRFKATQAIKGFAFIEFDSPEAADKALEAYGVQKDNKPSLEPEELQTIKSFNQEQETEAKDEAKNESTEQDVKKEKDGASEIKADDAKANPEQDEEKAKSTRKKNRRHK